MERYSMTSTPVCVPESLLGMGYHDCRRTFLVTEFCARDAFSYVPAMILKLLGSDSFAFPLFFGWFSSALTPVCRGDPFIRFAEIGTNFCFLDAGAAELFPSHNI
jgi:hypothetical protein